MWSCFQQRTPVVARIRIPLISDGVAGCGGGNAAVTGLQAVSRAYTFLFQSKSCSPRIFADAF